MNYGTFSQRNVSTLAYIVPLTFPKRLTHHMCTHKHKAASPATPSPTTQCDVFSCFSFGLKSFFLCDMFIKKQKK